MSDVNQSAAPAAPEAVSQETANESVESQENEVQEAEAVEGQNEESSEESKEAAKEAKKEEAQLKKTLKKLKIKFNGKEYDEELPFEIPDDEKSREYMTKQLQMSKLSQSKAKEAAELEKEVRSFIEELKKNPRKVLSDPNIGVDIKQLAASIIEEEIANSQKSPEQLEREKMEAELKALKEEREREKEEFKKREFERIQQEAYERYDMQMSQAIEKSDLPKSPYVVKKMADYMLLGLQNNVDLTPDEIVPLVKEEIQKDIKDMFAVMPDEVIEQIIGKDIIGRLRKKQIAKAKSAPVPVNKAVKDTVKKASGDSDGNEGKMTIRDFFKI